VVSTSSASPAVGDKLTVFLRITRDVSAAKVGSFAAQITYDSTAVQWNAMVDRGEGFVAANSPTKALLLVAGANVQGFANDTVVAVTFTMLKAGAPTLQLRMTEITTTSFDSKVTP
jgi:hypothetical protein